MCSKTLFIATILTDMLKVHPNDKTLTYLKNKAFYTAPEIADHLWNAIFSYVSVTYNSDEKIYTLYQDGYNKYLNTFSV